MKCIDKYIKGLFSLFLIIIVLSGCSQKSPSAITDFESTNYSVRIQEISFFATSLAVTNVDVERVNYKQDERIDAAGLFSVDTAEVLYAQNVHKQIYPASTTKVLTAYIAYKYGNLDDMVTVSRSATILESAASTCGLKEGDVISLRDLIAGLILYSGCDNGVVIAEHISGSVEAFSDLMNEEARLLGATKSNFTNPHGLHEENHYSTAYDLYLIFAETVKNEDFLSLISMSSYTTNATEKGTGYVRKNTWAPTHFYASGKATKPTNVDVVGGKTGTTDEAGSCVVLLEKDALGQSYISIIMGASTKPVLYENMTELLQTIPN